MGLWSVVTINNKHSETILVAEATVREQSKCLFEEEAATREVVHEKLGYDRRSASREALCLVH